MATVTTSHPGNMALQQEVWTLTLAEGKHVLATALAAPKGSYWETTLLKPWRRATRAWNKTFTVYTAGFSTGELANALRAAGETVTRI